MCVVAYLLSLPLWERGFKHQIVQQSESNTSRSPCGSVDLNRLFGRDGKLGVVAPLVGAWI